MPVLSPPGRGDVRPGAMTAVMRAMQPATSRELWARVAIVRVRANERVIVEQRWVRPGQELTWGRTERADVVVASAPHDHAPLVVPEGASGHALVLDGAITGRLAIRDATLQLADEARRGARRLVLDEGARAQVGLGGIEVLLEIVPRPPAPRRAPLPASLARGLGIDPRFTAVAVASLMVHALFVTALAEHDWPAPSDAARLLRVADLVFVEPAPPPAPVPVREDAPPSEVARDETPSRPTEVADAHHAPAVRRGAPGRGSPQSAPDVEALREEVAAAVDLRIGAIGGDGALSNLLRDGALPASQAEVMGLVRSDEHAALAPRAGSMPGVRGGSRGLDAMGGCEGCVLDVHRTGEAQEGHGGAEDERPVTVRVPPQEIEHDAPRGGFDSDALVRALRGRMGAVRACYERALGDDPTLAGRIELEMTVERVGTLSGVEVRAGSIGNDAFHGCVERSVGSVRLREGPTEGPVQVSFPIVLAPQG